ncbi:hypothetical protein E2P65_02575 [Candidatus Bathyarchaeota archaeon]|nr:hypothetical protein E2P65_02575 [Candidatus Bathyarchaeota archaeon]
MKNLEGFAYHPAWVSHMGCLIGCARHLGLTATDSWIYGATGHAFAINISPDSCPSGPTAWNTAPLFHLGKNVGYTPDGVFATRTQPDFREKQRQAYDHVRTAIDRGHPCYGWELDIAEFYLIDGYDEAGYHHRGPTSPDGAGPKPWQELGDTEIGVLEVYSISPGTPAPPERTLRESIAFALEQSEGTYAHPNYTAGPPAYATWADGIRDASASPSGIAYNAQCWHECRHHAARFLREAATALPDHTAPLQEAAAHYADVAAALKALTEIYPFTHPPEFEKTIPKDDRQGEAIAALGCAREAEEAGLASLRAVLERL